MTSGRLTGDRIVAALGPRRVALLGSLCAATGLFLAVLLPFGAAALAGFVLVGLGASNIVPIFFSAAARHPSMPPTLAISAVTTLGYAGLLAGPALIGFVTALTSLPTALGGVAALVLVVSASARTAVR
jgi:fucose permease